MDLSRADSREERGGNVGRREVSDGPDGQGCRLIENGEGLGRVTVETDEQGGVPVVRQEVLPQDPK